MSGIDVALVHGGPPRIGQISLDPRTLGADCRPEDSIGRLHPARRAWKYPEQYPIPGKEPRTTRHPAGRPTHYPPSRRASVRPMRTWAVPGRPDGDLGARVQVEFRQD